MDFGALWKPPPWCGWLGVWCVARSQFWDVSRLRRFRNDGSQKASKAITVTRIMTLKSIMTLKNRKPVMLRVFRTLGILYGALAHRKLGSNKHAHANTNAKAFPHLNIHTHTHTCTHYAHATCASQNIDC